MLKRITPAEWTPIQPVPQDAAFQQAVRQIVDDVRTGGDASLRACAARFDGAPADQPLLLGRADLDRAVAALADEDRALLQRTADRIRRFAEAQRAAVSDVDLEIDGGRAGHRVLPVDVAGCYAPAGSYPLVSSALMTAVTARAAGVSEVYVATPQPHPLLIAAAGVAQADGVLLAGGAQAIAALAYGTETVPRCGVVVGPGNRWVTAAKQLVSGDTRIDMLAGPSELVVWADDSARADWVAADLLAQAEHDTDACPILVSQSAALVDVVDEALGEQLKLLPTAEVARVALRNGSAMVVDDAESAAAVINIIAPEHLEIQTRSPRTDLDRVRNYGCAFLGARTAEVLGDYGAGPNHTLPTGGTARSVSGLSVFSFLRMPTWLEVEGEAEEVFSDAQALAEAEGLIGHRESVRVRV